MDLNRDGWDDLIIGSGKGGMLAVYQNNGAGGFERLKEPPFTQVVTRDQTRVLGGTKQVGKWFCSSVPPTTRMDWRWAVVCGNTISKVW